MRLRARTDATQKPIGPKNLAVQKALASIAKKRSKYRAVPTVVDGIRFDSKKEANHYATLKVYERTGHIRNLELQPAYCMTVNGIDVGTYRADFRYQADDLDAGWIEIVQDVKSKGTRTALYRLKKKIVEAQYGIRIQEV